MTSTLIEQTASCQLTVIHQQNFEWSEMRFTLDSDCNETLRVTELRRYANWKSALNSVLKHHERRMQVVKCEAILLPIRTFTFTGFLNFTVIFKLN